MAQEREEGRIAGLVVGSIGGATFATLIATLVAARPGRAAPTDEKLDYLIEVLTTLVPVLASLAERQAALIELLEKWLAGQGMPGVPTVEVGVLTPWLAKAPELIFQSAIRSAGTFYSDKMMNYTESKRILFKVESSLNQAVSIQIIGDIVDSKERAVDIGPVLNCPANGNISIGLAWDDWHPYIGVKITVVVAPTAGLLTISAVVQD